MAFENIQINDANFAIDPIDGSGFYTFDNEGSQLIKKSSSGTTISSNFLDTSISEVVSLEYNGVYFWTLERVGSTAFTVRKWELGSDTLVRNIFNFSYSTDSTNSYNTQSFSLEWYEDSLDNSALAGSPTVIVADGSKVRVGDEITIGPSTALGYVGRKEVANVIGKTGTTLTLSTGLDFNYSPNDRIVFDRSLFVFSDTSPANQPMGALYKFNTQTGALQTSTTSELFGLVTASTFFSGYVMFVRGGEIIWFNPDTQRIFKSQAIDNLEAARDTYYETHDLTGFSNTLYRLEEKRITYNSGTGVYTTNEWSSYNYNTSSIVPEVYFVILKADPTIIHKAVSGLVPTSSIFVQVLDQFRSPVFNKLVQLTSTGGALSPTQDTTNVNGVITSVYTANTTEGEIKITATVN
jgi:hypothetical protein